jgi:hypothetical protein
MKVSGALAWNQQVAMSKEEIDEFLSGRWVARLASLGRDGYPHIAPLWYYWDGECLYFELTQNRQSCRNLRRDRRCSVVIDMDDRPLMGLRSNMAKAVVILGDTELIDVGSGKKVRIEAGPWKGEHAPEQAVAMIISRYGLSERDGAIGMNWESFLGLLSRQDLQESRLIKENSGRVLLR